MPGIIIISITEEETEAWQVTLLAKEYMASRWLSRPGYKARSVWVHSSKSLGKNQNNSLKIVSHPFLHPALLPHALEPFLLSACLQTEAS